MIKYYVERERNCWVIWRTCKDKSETLVATFHPQSPSSVDHRAEMMAKNYCKRLNGKNKG